MNISSEIFPSDGSNSSSNSNATVDPGIIHWFLYSIICAASVLLGLPTNSYVIWLIVTGTGNGLAAEFFSLNLSVCDIFLCIECVFIVLSYEFEYLWGVVGALDGLALIGNPLFQCLICVERYLAVVHPVTFLKYKPLRYRVICSVFVWVTSFGSSGIIIFLMSQPVLYFLLLFPHFCIFLSVELFCCVAVLRALKQSGPGERGRERKEENHMKRRAFNFILITAVTMLLVYVPYIILLSLFVIADNQTVMSISFLCFGLAGLVQPLLFLYRMRKLPFIKYQ